MRGISAEALILCAVEWLFITIAFCLIIARINLRVFHLKAGFVLSDAFIAAAFAAGISLNAVDITLYLGGVYEPNIDFKMTNWVATEAETVDLYRTQYFLYFPFYCEQYFNKGTLLALYYEIFGKGSTKIRASLLCLVAYCAAGFITTMCMVLFYCKWGCYWYSPSPSPSLSAFHWVVFTLLPNLGSIHQHHHHHHHQRLTSPPRSQPHPKSYTAICPQRCWTVNDNLGWAFHFSSDVFIFILPLVYISKLNMSKAQKISASVTFSIGLVSILITLSRWFVVQAVFTEVPALNTGQLLAVLDGHTGLIVSILPSLRPYIRLWQNRNDSRPAKSNATYEGLTTGKEETPSTSRVTSSSHDSNKKAEE
ncbi:hypothetical protein CSHISOI_06639, partial [Colletotrichum shisoi]